MTGKSRDDERGSRHDGVRDVSSWIREARAGSTQSLGRALEACRSYLRVVATKKLPRKLRSKESRSDLVQRTLHQATKDFDRFQGKGAREFKAWLHAILHTQALAVHRHFNTGTRAIDREVALDGSGSERRDLEQPAAPRATPLEEMLRREESAIVRKALSQLDADDQQVIELCQTMRGDSSWSEIASELGVSTGAARARWYRAIEKLRAKVKSLYEQ